MQCAYVFWQNLKEQKKHAVPQGLFQGNVKGKSLCHYAVLPFSCKSLCHYAVLPFSCKSLCHYAVLPFSCKSLCHYAVLPFSCKSLCHYAVLPFSCKSLCHYAVFTYIQLFKYVQGVPPRGFPHLTTSTAQQHTTFSPCDMS